MKSTRNVPPGARLVIRRKTVAFIREAVRATGKDLPEAYQVVAAKVGASPNSVRGWFLDDTWPNFIRCEAICRALGREYPS